MVNSPIGSKLSTSSIIRSKIVVFLRNLIRQREAVLVGLILVECLIMTILSPYFFSVTNFTAITRGFSMEGIVTIGQALLLIAAQFDLSVGAVMALTGIVTAWLIVTAHVPYTIAVLGGVGTGAFVGWINGVLVTKLRINALIATLGTMIIIRSVALGFTEGNPVINVPLSFAWIGQGSVGPIPVPFIILVVIGLVIDILLRRGRTLRQLYYIGGNSKAAQMSGIPVDKVVLFTFVLTGVTAAFGGIITMARLTSGIPTVFSNVALTVIAASVIGGMSLSGGKGTVLGALLGLVFMALISNAMTLLGVSVYWEGTVTGTILLVAVGLDMFSHRNS